MREKYENILLLSDMDGTLLNSQSKISQDNKEAITYFIEHGGQFGIATGRSPLNFVRYLDDIKINAPCILYNGGALYNYQTKEILEQQTLPTADLIDLIKYTLSELPQIMIQIYCPEMCYIISPENLADSKTVELHRPCQFVPLETIQEKPWIKILFSAQQAELKKLEKCIFDYNVQNKVNALFTSEIYLELMPLGASKGSMLEPLRREVGEGYKIFAVGDYTNDLEMVKAADIGIAVGNATRELKEAADYVCVNCDRNAIWDVIFGVINRELSKENLF